MFKSTIRIYKLMLLGLFAYAFSHGAAFSHFLRLPNIFTEL